MCPGLRGGIAVLLLQVGFADANDAGVAPAFNVHDRVQTALYVTERAESRFAMPVVRLDERGAPLEALYRREIYAVLGDVAAARPARKAYD